MVTRLKTKMGKRGISIVFAIFTLLVLSVLALTIFSMISSDIGSSATSLRATRLFYIAESGIEIMAGIIKDDKGYGGNITDPTAEGYSSVAYLEGGYNGSYSGVNVTNPERACIHGTSYDDPARYPAVVQGVTNASLAIWNFQQRYNLIGSKLYTAKIVCVAKKEAQSDPAAQFVMQFSTDGGATWMPDGFPYIGFFFIVNSAQWPAERGVYFESPLIALNWEDLMSNNGNDFRIRVLRLDIQPTNVEIDWLALVVNTEVDAMTEPWANMGSHPDISFPAPLGDGTLLSIAGLRSAAAININNAPHMIMKEVFEYGLTEAEADTLATNVINYRNSVKLFNKVEEIKQIEGGIDPAAFTAIKPHITVFSWRNVDLPYYTNGVSPVNINFVSNQVLKKMVECAGLAEGVAVTAADLIVSQRATDPFTCMYSSYQIQEIGGSRDEKSLAGFLRANLAWGDDDFCALIDLLDGSAYNMSLTENWHDPPITDAVPASFSTHAFMLSSDAGLGDMREIIYRTYGNVYDYTDYIWNQAGTYRLPIDHTDTDPKGYWRTRY